MNGFLHTIISVFLPVDINIKTKLEKIGDTGISLDWAAQDLSDKSLFIILPGLTGKAGDSYIN